MIFWIFGVNTAPFPASKLNGGSTPEDFRAFPVTQQVKNLPARQRGQEMLVRSLIREDPLKKEMASYFGILGWEIPQTEEPGWSQSTGLQRVGHDWERDAWEFFIHIKKKFSKILNVLLTSQNLKFFVSYLGHLLFGAFWNMQLYLEKYCRHSLFNPALTSDLVPVILPF